MNLPKDKPTARKSVPMNTSNDEAAERDIEALFAGETSPVQTPGADDFISQTQRTKVAIIVPLYGYWQDIKDGFLDEEVLDASLERARSYAHSAYIILVAEPPRMPVSVAKVINSKYIAGNARGVAMPAGSSYGDYLRKGMDVALHETDAAFFVFINPWVVIQDHGIDTLIDRINIPDNAPVICGYEMNGKLSPDTFLHYKANAPYEQTVLTFNFFGMNRFIAEMAQLDPSMRTQTYLERDFFQSIASRGYTAVSSERVPIFSFAFDWRQYTSPEDYEHDKAAFLKKWKFLPEGLNMYE